MALHHKVLPPTIKVERPNPTLEIETQPVLPQHRTRGRGSATAAHPRRAAVVELRLRRQQLPRRARGVRRAGAARPPAACAPRRRELVLLGAQRRGRARRRSAARLRGAPAGSSRRPRARVAARLPTRATRRGSRSCAASAAELAAKLAPGGAPRIAKAPETPLVDADRDRLFGGGRGAGRRRLPVPRPGQPVRRHGRGPGDVPSTPRARRGTGPRRTRFDGRARCTRWSSRRPPSPTRSATRRRAR